MNMADKYIPPKRPIWKKKTPVDCGIWVVLSITTYPTDDSTTMELQNEYIILFVLLLTHTADKPSDPY